MASSCSIRTPTTTAREGWLRKRRGKRTCPLPLWERAASAERSGHEPGEGAALCVRQSPLTRLAHARAFARHPHPQGGKGKESANAIFRITLDPIPHHGPRRNHPALRSRQSARRLDPHGQGLSNQNRRHRGGENPRARPAQERDRRRCSGASVRVRQHGASAGAA